MENKVQTKSKYPGFEAWTLPSNAPEWKLAPRVNELPDNVDVHGFTSEKEFFVRGLVQRIGLPLNRVTEISHEVNAQGTENTLGQAYIHTGRLNFFKKMEDLPAHGDEASQVGVATHELAHINTPFYEENVNAYGGEKEMRKAAENAILVAVQTDSSHKFMNGYHKWLYKETAEGRMDQQTFVEECNAIMTELRFANPKHLEEVLRAQNPDTADQILNQLDSTLMKLMDFKTKDQLNDHIQNLRKHYLPKPSKVDPDQI